MTTHVKRLIVDGLERACSLLDRVPAIYRYEGRWHIGTGCWGCYVFHLSSLSARLDERWQTGHWR